MDEQNSKGILNPLHASDFPNIQIVQASAGSGKTYVLTQKIVQFLLSSSIPYNKINNIVAITFTKNATNDIKKKILEWLKKIYLDLLNEEEKQQIMYLTKVDKKNLAVLSSDRIDDILNNYSDLILTIDSFITKIIRSSAIELGLNPDFDVDVDSRSIIDYAFDEFLEGAHFSDLRGFLDFLNENSNHTVDFQVVNSIKSKLNYLLDQESSHKSAFHFNKTILDRLKVDLAPVLEEMLDLLERYANEATSTNVNPKKIENLKNFLKEKNLLSIVDNEIKFPYKDKEAKSKWQECVEKINYKLYDIAKIKYLPYLKLFFEFKSNIVRTYNVLGKTFLPDVNKRIINLLEEGYVPTIYFTLGSYIYHYLIDEFQDTSKIQWEMLKPLIDESLSKGGSLFIVGDLKQSIYGFRKADFEIMKNLIDNAANIFPQSKCSQKTLELNYRSFEHIVNYSKSIFKDSLKSIMQQTNDPTGYLSFVQNPLEKNLGKGYVETKLFSFENDEGIDIIKENLLETIDSLVNSGIKCNQIAILALTNKEINTISGWLLEKNYTVLSQSANDIRQRKIINELLSLLRFFNNPSDKLNFATFLLSDIFCHIEDRNKIMEFLLENRLSDLLYINFRENFKYIWDMYFRDIFNSISYIPIYELMLNIIKTFKIDENFQQESHYLSFFLDKILELEDIGINDLDSFIDFFDNNEPLESKFFSCEFSNIQNGIQLLTIHKSKGLQFDVVINVLNADKNYALNPNKKANIVNQFVFENENVLDLLYIKKDFALKNNTLENIYNKTLTKDNIEDCNILYVALTRAKMQLYNFIYYKQTSKTTCMLKPIKLGTKHDNTKNLSLESKANLVRFKVNYNKFLSQPPIWTVKRFKEAIRGEIYHKILSNLKYEEDFEKLDILISKYTKFLDFDIKKTKQQILSLLKQKEIKKLFDKKNTVFTEKTFIDRNGSIFRMDRVIIDINKNITVLDYKTGISSKQEVTNYKLQVINYMNIIKEVFETENVSGLLYNFDTQEVITVE